MSNQRFEMVLRNGNPATIERVYGDDAWDAARKLEFDRLGWGPPSEFAETAPATTWVAYVDEDDGRTPAGIAGYTRPRDHRTPAEMVVKVGEAYRGVGLGTMLFETLLLNALEHGLDHLVAHVPSDSSLAVKLMSRASSHRPAVTTDHVQMKIPVSSSERTLRSSAVTLPVIRVSRS